MKNKGGEIEYKRFKISPIGKPRMTQRDKWKKRQCVVNYWLYKDSLKKEGFKLANQFTVLFCIPFPKSYSKKKCKELFLKPHQEKPDLDNMLKALLDCLNEEDKEIYRVNAKKIWSYKPSIFIINKH